MLAALAINWVFVLHRVAIAVIFGVIVLVGPELRSSGLVSLFGAYALSDGLLALVVALGVKGAAGFGSLLFEALVRLGVGILAFVSPGWTALALPDVFAAWAVLSGVAAIATAITLRRDLTGEWPLPLAGFTSLLCGGLLLLGFRHQSLEWVIGPYAILFALTLLALALRLRQIAAEIAAV